MPRLRLSQDEDLDYNAEDLDNEPYDPDEDRRVRYTGEMPPVGTILPGYASKMWLVYTAEKPDAADPDDRGGDPMLKVLFIADDNAGEYQGCPVFDNIVLNKKSKWRWYPFLTNIGLTIHDVWDHLYVAKDDDNVGTPIEKINKWVPGEDQDAAYYRIITGRHMYNKEWQLDADEYLPYEDGEGPAEPDPPARSTRSGKPARNSGSSSTRSSGSARGSRRAAEPADEPDDAGDESGDEAAAPARGGRRGASRTAQAAKPAASGRGRGRRASSGDGDEPPF